MCQDNTSVSYVVYAQQHIHSCRVWQNQTQIYAIPPARLGHLKGPPELNKEE